MLGVELSGLLCRVPASTGAAGVFIRLGFGLERRGSGRGKDASRAWWSQLWSNHQNGVGLADARTKHA